MVEKSMMETDEEYGDNGAPRYSVPSGRQHRDAMHVADNDYMSMPSNVVSHRADRPDQVDTVAIEYLDGAMPMGPRTIAEGVRAGGYDQPGDQSCPESGPRVTAGMRGAADIGKS
jgi:hypothetical protein